MLRRRVSGLALASVLVLASAPAPAAGPSAPAAPAKAVDLANADPATPACVDFYQHANGGWLKANPIPADKSRWGAFEELADRNRAVLKGILEETAAKNDWPKGSPRQKVGDFYASGMDVEAIEKAGSIPLEPWLAKVEALKGTDALPALLADLHGSGVRAGYGFFVGQDQKESTRYVPMLSQGGLGLPDRDYYLKDDPKSKEMREKYVAHVARMLGLLGEAPEAARKGAETVMALETRLAKASRTRVELRDPEKNYNKRTLAALSEEAPGYSWKAYFAARGVPGSQELNVRQPDFAKAFASLASEVPLAEWKTYLRWHVVRSAAPYLPKRFEEADFDFFGRTLNGVPEQEERWKRVLAATDRGLGEALGQIYVERAFSARSKERMKALVENLRTALGERIDGLAWMGPETKKQARKKLAAFGVKIGYPDRWRDYTALEVSRGSYLANVVAANVFEAKRNLGKLGKPIDRTEWGMTPPTVNAYYSPTMNEIVFPAGILQPPFFWADADDAVNYGAIGVVIGHEMTHGFDDSGSKYDAEGNLKNWWTEEDRKSYEARTDLVVKQFDAYRALPDQAVNGKLTLGENVSDLGGLKVAYAALAKALGKDPLEAPAVDGFSPAQRFFLSYAGVWRNNIREEALRVRLNTDSHSPGRFRVVGPLSALPEFHRAFGCAAGNAMWLPEAERPSIW
ncbi:M13 family metallopeptidase [Acidobacteria bacterium ACD]|nr:MAG: M13 family peptidase [Acidobacteriota bacterium]MDL1950320.1 M13 family metallopeptidase [Acidobacteria bacterium ACD]